MRVLVLVPTTGALNRVLRIVARPDLPASQVIIRYKPLAISGDYNALTAKAGPLAALGPPVMPGPHQLWLAGEIESGNSWELPVLLAHLVVALGAELAEDPAKADIVLWSTGEVDLDLRIADNDYKLAAKVAYSRTALREAVAAGAEVLGILPASEDASPLRDLLTEVGAPGARVDLVNNVGAARVILEQALGRTRVLAETVVPAVAAVAEPDPAGAVIKAVTTGNLWKIPALLAVGAAMALGAFIAGSDVIPLLMKHRASTSGGPRIAATEEQPPPIRRPVAPGDGSSHAAERKEPPPVTGPAVPDDVALHAAESKQPPQATGPVTADGGADNVKNNPGGPGPEGQAAVPEAVMPHEQLVLRPPPVPVKLEELRAPNGGICVPVLIERRTPTRIPVAFDGPDHFHDSTGLNLCGLEWTLNPEAAQSGVQGFDIDLPGFSLMRTGVPGAWTKITVEFKPQLSRAITYNVRMKFAGAPPAEQVQQFRHTIR